MSHPAFRRTAHRPWKIPRSPWTWRQTWSNLLFAHWPVPASALKPFIPQPLALQEFDGSAWLGVVPFRMEGVARRSLPRLPGVSTFLELNVRTYVEAEGKSGVWFFSLDANNRLAVWAARRFFHLPYYRAEMSMHHANGWFAYQCRRLSKEPVMFLAQYRPVSSQYEATPGTLEHWLTERYCLYARSRSGELYRTEVHHHPWPLQQAEAEITVNSMVGAQRLPLADVSPTLHFARRLDVAVWPPERLGGSL